MTQFDKIFNFMKKPLTIFVFFCLMVLSFLFVDKGVASYFHQLGLRTNATMLHLLTALGKWQFYVFIFLFAGLYFRFFHKNPIYEKNSWFLFACVFITNFLNLFFKIGFGRARPDLLFSLNEYGFYWLKLRDVYWSFPSGHAITMTALASGLSVLLPRYFILFYLAALCVICTRVILYYHYLSDVLTGFYLSILVVGVVTLYFKKNHWLD